MRKQVFTAGTGYALKSIVASPKFIGALAALVLCLSSAPALARPLRTAQVATSANKPADPAALRRATDEAKRQADRTIALRAQARREKAELDKVYETQLAEIDQLKRQRASWRRDRLLRTRLSESLSTAEKLAALDQQIRVLDRTVQGQQRALMVALDRELAAAPVAGRAESLVRWRRDVARALKPAVKKIVLPDADIDPLADPEELEYQASLIRQSEEQLARELAKLDKLTGRYERMALLQSKSRRAAELGRFDDDQPRRAGRSSGDGRDSEGPVITTSDEGSADTSSSPPSAPGAEQEPSTPAPAPPPVSDAPESGGTRPGSDDISGTREDPMFDVVLADVVDAGTISALRAADLSSNPAVKASATKRAHDQVKQRLEALRKRRELIQKRARSLQE